MMYIKKQRVVEGRSENVELEEAVKFFKEYCTQYNPKLSIIYRGVKDVKGLYNNYMIIKPSNHIRTAGYSNTTYLNIFDNLESWKDYPKRSKSIICSTSRSISKSFGEVYVVIPTNNSIFGVAPHYDFQSCFKKFSSRFGLPIYRIDEFFDNRSDEYTFDEFKYIMSAGEFNEVEFSFRYREYISENKLSGEDIMKEMFEYLSPILNGFRIFNYDGKTDISNIKANEISLTNSNEVWTSDNCLLIKSMYYKKFLREVGVDEEFVSNLLI